MRLSFAVIGGWLLAVCLTACGDGSSVIGSHDATPAVAAHHRVPANVLAPGSDRDNDNDKNDDDALVLGFGHAANATETTRIISLLTNYYAAAANDDGKSVCAMLTPFVAEAIPEEHENDPQLRGVTCADVMTKEFRPIHTELIVKSATLQVHRIGIEGDKSLVALYFPRIPEVRQITLRRVGRRWTVLHVLDDIIE